MRMIFGLILALGTSLPAAATETGDFDYYVMSLSWSPNWCDRTGNARGSAQCGEDRDLGWTLHGLWPQYEQGWPAWCETEFDAPNRDELEAVKDLYGTASLARYQWQKHGSCSGLDAQGYLGNSIRAYFSVQRPSIFRTWTEPRTVPARAVEKAFLLANPALEETGVTVTCKSRQIQEVRICLTKELTPRQCGEDVRRDCTLEDAVMYPVP